MGIRISWDNTEETILLETFEATWTLDDYHQMIDDAAALLAQTPHIVHIICDGTHSKTIPTQILSGARYAIKKMPENQGIVVFVGANLFAKAIINIAKTIAPTLVDTIEHAETLEEARQIIYKKSQIK